MPTNISGRRRKATGPLSIDAPTTAIGSKNSPKAGAEQRLPVLVAAIPDGDGEIRVALAEVKGLLTIDVRLFEPITMARALSPTKKGVTLNLSKLPDLVHALSDAMATAEAMGVRDGAR